MNHMTSLTSNHSIEQNTMESSGPRFVLLAWYLHPWPNHQRQHTKGTVQIQIQRAKNHKLLVSDKCKKIFINSQLNEDSQHWTTIKYYRSKFSDLGSLEQNLSISNVSAYKQLQSILNNGLHEVDGKEMVCNASSIEHQLPRRLIPSGGSCRWYFTVLNYMVLPVK